MIFLVRRKVTLYFIITFLLIYLSYIFNNIIYNINYYFSSTSIIIQILIMILSILVITFLYKNGKLYDKNSHIFKSIVFALLICILTIYIGILGKMEKLSISKYYNNSASIYTTMKLINKNIKLSSYKVNNTDGIPVIYFDGNFSAISKDNEKNIRIRYDSNEKTLVKLENDLSVFGCNVINMPKEKIISHHASSEDLMLMIKLIQPKHYMPVKGEYRYMVNNANLANRLEIPSDKIILKQNGDVVTFIDGKLQESYDHIKVNDVLIDGLSNDDVGEVVIKDREMLSENGIVLISATISKKDKVLLVGPEVTSRGFIYVKDSKDLIIEMKKICEKIITRNVTPAFVDYNKIKVEIREELSKYLYEETECKPMIIAVVQEV